MSDPDSKTPPGDSADAAAAHWLARRDRGWSAAEQAAFLKWQGADPRHATAVAKLEKVWGMLDRLAERRLAGGLPPDPDLLAPSRRRSLSVWAPLLAAAVVAAFVYYARTPVAGPKTTAAPPAPPAAGQAIIHPGPEQLTLEDGSIVELNGQAKVEVQFTPAERRVRLVRGEAYFAVAKNPSRPFIVSAGAVTVRAVGTAFSVGLGREALSVLVTEGKVRVDETPPPLAQGPAAPRELSALSAGQQGVIAFSGDYGATARGEMKVIELTAAQQDRALAWRSLRLEFVAMPLGRVVAEFNRYNRPQLIVADAETAAILVGGTFRADNVDAFVRLLNAGFGVSAFPNGENIILRKPRHD